MDLLETTSKGGFEIVNGISSPTLVEESEKKDLFVTFHKQERPLFLVRPSNSSTQMVPFLKRKKYFCVDFFSFISISLTSLFG